MSRSRSRDTDIRRDGIYIQRAGDNFAENATGEDFHAELLVVPGEALDGPILFYLLSRTHAFRSLVRVLRDPQRFRVRLGAESVLYLPADDEFKEYVVKVREGVHRNTGFIFAGLDLIARHIDTLYIGCRRQGEYFVPRLARLIPLTQGV